MLAPLLDYLITGVPCSCSPAPLHRPCAPAPLLRASSSLAGAPARLPDFGRPCSCPALQARELPPASLCSRRIAAPSPSSAQRLPGRAQLSGCSGWQVDEESRSSDLQQRRQLWKLAPNPPCPPPPAPPKSPRISTQRLPGRRRAAVAEESHSAQVDDESFRLNKNLKNKKNKNMKT